MTNTTENFVHDAINNTTVRRLRYMPYAQAHWDVTEWHDGTETWGMTSYASRIFTASKRGGMVYRVSVQGARAAINYSRTTSRQVTMAMREIGLTDNAIVMLKKWFTSDSKHVTAVYAGRGQWTDGTTGEAIF